MFFLLLTGKENTGLNSCNFFYATDSQYSLYSNPNSDSNDERSQADSSPEGNSQNTPEVQDGEGNGGASSSRNTPPDTFSKLLPGKTRESGDDGVVDSCYISLSDISSKEGRELRFSLSTCKATGSGDSLG